MIYREKNTKSRYEKIFEVVRISPSGKVTHEVCYRPEDDTEGHVFCREKVDFLARYEPIAAKTKPETIPEEG